MSLSPTVIRDARALVEQARPLPRIAPAPAAPARSTHLDALWAWYVDWSQTARATISDRSLLRVLGFSKPGRPKG